jgi:AcrR family transcriptional regulator
MTIEETMTRTERLQKASQKRRDREKQELRRKILAAATDLFLEYGYEEFSLRQVAEEIGYSPGTIYLHFKDKDDLVFSIADEGFLRFGQTLENAATGTDDPLQRLIDMSQAYILFGLQNPEHYQLMFMQRTDYLFDRPEEDFIPRINSFDILQQAVDQAIAAGVVRNVSSLAIADSIWAQFHGIVALAIGMANFYTRERALLAAEQAIITITKGLKP